MSKKVETARKAQVGINLPVEVRRWLADFVFEHRTSNTKATLAGLVSLILSDEGDRQIALNFGSWLYENLLLWDDVLKFRGTPRSARSKEYEMVMKKVLEQNRKAKLVNQLTREVRHATKSAPRGKAGEAG